MGTMCSNFESLEEKKKTKQNYAKNTQMAKVIQSYFCHYGRQPSEETKKFIEDNYNTSYQSTVITLDGNYNYTGKGNLIDRFQTAYDNQWRVRSYNFIEANLGPNKTISYDFSIQSKGEVKHYHCFARFDEQNRLYNINMRQFAPYDHDKYMQAAWANKPQTSYQKPKEQSNQYNGPPPNIPDYNGMVQQSNQDFRDRMNKQAQEWNEYARQKNNRGW